MNLKAGLTLLFALFCFLLVQALKAQSKFDKAAFYQTMASEDLGKVNAQIDILKGADIAEKEGFEGALIMRKAGMTGGAKEKLSLFKYGHKSLEKAISKDENNIEFRFLRLIIQENAPRILGYHDDIEKDSKYIRENFKNQSPIIKNAISDYSKRSKALNPNDFSN
jgi:hypothetical protein